jgi:hypothetical protein
MDSNCGAGIVCVLDSKRNGIEEHVLTTESLLPKYPVHDELAAPPVISKLVGFFNPRQWVFCAYTQALNKQKRRTGRQRFTRLIPFGATVDDWAMS